MIKHFIDLTDFSKTEINKIISLAKNIKKNPTKYINVCKNKTLGMIFEKQSLRTRVSFNLGMKKIGGNVLEFQSKEVGFDNKREIDEDVLKVLSQYIDCLLIRNNNHNKLKKLAKKNILPIINGLTEYSHPCQILGDFLTIKEIYKDINKIKICWIGDFNNVLRSLIQLQNIFLFKLSIVLPKEILKLNQLELYNLKNSRIDIFTKPLEGSHRADCVMTDVWFSMGDKNKNKKKFFKNFTVNKNIMKNAKKNAIFMHCLPANRGEEVTSEVIDGKNSVVLEQAKNRMFIQQAILINVL